MIDKDKFINKYETLFISIILLSWNIVKKQSGHVGTRTCVTGLISQQICYARDHHESQKYIKIYIILYIDIYILYKFIQNIYKIIYKLRHSSIDYITKIASVMMRELTSDEWEKTNVA